jgi:hypothetical protein
LWAVHSAGAIRWNCALRSARREHATALWWSSLGDSVPTSDVHRCQLPSCKSSGSAWKLEHGSDHGHDQVYPLAFQWGRTRFCGRLRHISSSNIRNYGIIVSVSFIRRGVVHRGALIEGPWCSKAIWQHCISISVTGLSNSFHVLLPLFTMISLTPSL